MLLSKMKIIFHSSDLLLMAVFMMAEMGSFFFIQTHNHSHKWNSHTHPQLLKFRLDFLSPRSFNLWINFKSPCSCWFSIFVNNIDYLFSIQNIRKYLSIGRQRLHLLSNLQSRVSQLIAVFIVQRVNFNCNSFCI